MACKSEHDVPVGVNRTWVKQVETGAFPDVRRSFHVMRCNHCADSPCTEICPVTALHVRPDGIVDFDNRRCIGCKACMQACPYDALYIDPVTHTAAKCNFCSHRVDLGLQPACVVACPEQAIVTGDLHDPGSFIAQLVANEPVQVRRPEKGTAPSLYYIDGDQAALDPLASTPPGGGTAVDVRPLKGLGVTSFLDGQAGTAQRVYDAPKAGVLWGWHVSGYLSTKALAAGALLLPLFAMSVLGAVVPREALLACGLVSLLMQAATAALLVGDLERPDRFLYVILRGNPSSWLVRGAWILSAFGLVSSAWLALLWWGGTPGLVDALSWAAWLLALPTAGYTAFLLAQAKARDLWQSPLALVHMLVHAVVGGAAVCLLLDALVGGLSLGGGSLLALQLGVAADLALAAAEIAMPHATRAAALAARRLHTGPMRGLFWAGFAGAGLAAILAAALPGLGALAASLALVSLVVRNDLWVRVPQTLPVS